MLGLIEFRILVFRTRSCYSAKLHACFYTWCFRYVERWLRFKVVLEEPCGCQLGSLPAGFFFFFSIFHFSNYDKPLVDYLLFSWQIHVFDVHICRSINWPFLFKRVVEYIHIYVYTYGENDFLFCALKRKTLKICSDVSFKDDLLDSRQKNHECQQTKIISKRSEVTTKQNKIAGKLGAMAPSQEPNPASRQPRQVFEELSCESEGSRSLSLERLCRGYSWKHRGDQLPDCDCDVWVTFLYPWISLALLI